MRGRSGTSLPFLLDFLSFSFRRLEEVACSVVSESCGDIVVVVATFLDDDDFFRLVLGSCLTGLPAREVAGIDLADFLVSGLGLSSESTSSIYAAGTFDLLPAILMCRDDFACYRIYIRAGKRKCVNALWVELFEVS